MISPASSTGPAPFTSKPRARRRFGLHVPTVLASFLANTSGGRPHGGPSAWVHSFAAAVYFSTRRSRLAWLLALGAFSLAGALHIQLRAGCEQLDTTILPYADRHAVDVIAHVTKDGRVQQNDFGETRQSIDVEAEQIRTASTEIVPTHSGIRLNLYSRRTDTEDRSLTAASKNEIRVLHYGERLRLADLRVAMPSLLVSALAEGAWLIALWTARRRALLTFAGHSLCF